MRVISGTARGCKLSAPEGYDTRPTADRIKESLFNMIAADIYDSIFLDLFSGTGQIGIEALSRGAKEAFFIEHDKNCGKIITYNLKYTSLIDKARIIIGDYNAGIKALALENKKFDIIFLDPPYNKKYTDNALLAIAEFSLLDKNGFIIAEQGAGEHLTNVDDFDIYKEKRYKTTAFIFLRHKQIQEVTL